MRVIRPLDIYIVSLAAASGLVLGWAVSRTDAWYPTLTLGVLALVAGSLLERIRSAVSASLSASISVAAFLIAGPAGAVVATAFNLFLWRPRWTFMKRLYNGAQFILETALAGWVYLAVGGTYGDAVDVKDPRIVLPALLAYATLLAVNALLLSIVFKLERGTPILEVIRGSLAPTFVPMMGYGALGVLLAILWLGGLDAAASVFMLLPLFVARWAFAQYEAERNAHAAAIQALAKIVETKDLYTRGHSERVSHGVLTLGKVLGLTAERLQALGYAGLLHDVGKIGVPIGVIRKSGRLTDEEMDEIRLHPTRGVDLVGDIDFLDEAQRGILHHHERFDGSGYPTGLAGLDIPQFGRIISVADAFDSMTTSRSYRGARSIDEASAELQRCRGSHFDPVMVDAFLEGLARFGWRPEVADRFAAVDTGQAATIDHDDLPGVGAVPDSAAADPGLVAAVSGGARAELPDPR